MQFAYLSSTVGIKTISEDAKSGVFEVEGLFAGYGLTLGNAIRRVLLSSLPGAAVTEFKIKNAPHEFSTLPGILEDIVEVSMNVKKLRFRIHTDEPQVVTLKIKGEKRVTAADIVLSSQVEIVNKDQIIATLGSKDTELDMELKIEKGLGYSPVESRKEGKLAVGTIAVDALFTPVIRVNTKVDDMRVGERTDYNRLRLEVETDGTVSPSSALHKAANILKDHSDKISAVVVQDFDVSGVVAAESAESEKKKGKSKKES